MTWCWPCLAVLAAFVQEDLRNDVLRVNDGARFTNSRIVSVKVAHPPADPAGWEIAISSQVEAPPSWRPWVPVLAYEVGDGDGEKTIIAKLRDPAGRIQGPFRASIILDTAAPEGKASTPALARPGRILILSDVSDAFAMQLSDVSGQAGVWAPYASSTPFTLSSGTGTKSIVVRYRDEAGNVSVPITLSADVQEDAPGVEVANGIHSIRVAPLVGRKGVALVIEAAGLQEMEIRIDDADPLPRESFSARKLLDIETGEGSHRIRVRAWDATGAEYDAQTAFQAQDLAGLTPESEPEPPRYFLSVRGGLLINAFDFDALTLLGPRKLNPGAVGVARLELGVFLADPFFAKVAIEAGQGDEARSLTGEVDLGFHLRLGEVFSREAGVEAEFGVLYSKLWVDRSDFGDFDPGIGFRGAVGLYFQVSDILRADFTLEYRDVGYEWSGDVVNGDREARARGWGMTAGMSFRF